MKTMDLLPDAFPGGPEDDWLSDEVSAIIYEEGYTHVTDHLGDTYEVHAYWGCHTKKAFAFVGEMI